jgi:hemerythrin-like domain-containing protein
MPVQIGQKKESDFSDPLGLLSDCHRRIEHFLGVLIQLAGHAKDSSSCLLSVEEAGLLDKALTYFRNAAPKHTADEEYSLFPRMRASTQAEAALARLAELEHEHKAAALDHEIVDSIGRRWLSEGALIPEDSGRMAQALERLAAIYSGHIAMEDEELFPLAARLLRPEELAEVGREMAGRRGIQR